MTQNGWVLWFDWGFQTVHHIEKILLSKDWTSPLIENNFAIKIVWELYLCDSSYTWPWEAFQVRNPKTNRNICLKVTWETFILQIFVDGWVLDPRNSQKWGVFYLILLLGAIHIWRQMIWGHFWPTYLPKSDSIRWSPTYLPNLP